MHAGMVQRTTGQDELSIMGPTPQNLSAAPMPMVAPRA
jgi:hypothetical protein